MSSIVNRYNTYINSITPRTSLWDFKDKEKTLQYKIDYMLDKTQSIFKWSGLPESIPEAILERFLQTNGNVCFYKHNDTLYIFTGGLGGEPDVYYMPTIYTISNPALELSVEAKINIDCIVMPNDTMYLGLLPIITKFCTLEAETELTVDILIKKVRAMSLISASDDRTRKSAEKFLEDLDTGKEGVIGESPFFDGIKVQPFIASMGKGMCHDLIELWQYIKSGLYMELGLDATYNMKKSGLITAEIETNTMALLPFIDNMLITRQTFAEKVNNMFGTEIRVQLASAWKLEHLECEHVAEPEADTEEPDMESEPEADTEEPDMESEPEADTEEPDMESEPEADTEEPDMESEPEADTEEPDMESEPEADTEEPDMESEPEADAEEPDMESEPEADAEEPDMESEPEADAEEPDMESEPEEGTEAEPERESGPEADAEEPVIEIQNPEGKEITIIIEETPPEEGDKDEEIPDPE